MASVVMVQPVAMRPMQRGALPLADASSTIPALAVAHEEDFRVLSRLLPRDLRADFANVYAFAGWADAGRDVAHDPAVAGESLAERRLAFEACLAGETEHPVLVGVRETIARHSLPREPFDQLLDASAQDLTTSRYPTWDALLDFCRIRANPLGRLTLLLAGHHAAADQRLADATYTAVRLARMWRDVRHDAAERDRVYLPDEIARRHGLDLPLVAKAIRIDAATARERGPACCSACDLPSVGITATRPAFRAAMRELVNRTKTLFADGRASWPRLDGRVRPLVVHQTLAGEAILRAIEREHFDTMTRQPRVGSGARFAVVTRAALATLGR